MSASIHQESTPVIALHCSLGSGRQWTRLSEALGRGFEVIAPDLSGYGKNIARTILPTTLADEVALLDEQLDRVKGAVHLVGHSYGGAVAFKMATSARWASRIRSLTLIEPVLPTLLRDNAADIRLHDVFADMGTRLSVDLWNGMYMEALDRFLDFWNGSAPRTGQRSSQSETLNAEARLRMIEVIEKVPYDFTAILAEADVAQAAQPVARADAAGLRRAVALHDPARCHPTRRAHSGRRDEALAGGGPHVADHACEDDQPGDCRAYRTGG